MINNLDPADERIQGLLVNWKMRETLYCFVTQS
jgi:hypothetical protein